MSFHYELKDPEVEDCGGAWCGDSLEWPGDFTICMPTGDANAHIMHAYLETDSVRFSLVFQGEQASEVKRLVKETRSAESKEKTAHLHEQIRKVLWQVLTELLAKDPTKHLMKIINRVGQEAKREAIREYKEKFRELLGI